MSLDTPRQQPEGGRDEPNGSQAATPGAVENSDDSAAQTHRFRTKAEKLWVVVRRAVAGLYKTGITRMAAALAYRTIFSIIPVIAIGLLIFGSVVSEEQVDAGVRRLMGFAGVSQISVAPENIGPPTPIEGPMPPWEMEAETPGEVAPDDETVEKRDKVVFAEAEVEEIISDLVIRVNTRLKSLPTGWLALITGLVLLYAALSMLIEVEKSFNQVCGAPTGRSWLRRLILYWTMLTLGGVLLAATFWTGDAIGGWVRGGGGSVIRSSLAAYGVSVMISTVLLVVAYMAIPTVRLKFGSVLAGAFIAAVLWELGKLGFTSYLRYSTGYAKLYGSLALLPLFMLWVYVTWVIVLLGLQSAYALQHFHRLMAADQRADRAGPTLVDPAVVVSLAGALVRAHRSGKSPDAGELGASMNIDTTVVESLLRRLEKAGLVRRVLVGGDEEAGWIPARPAEKISLEEVLSAVTDLDASRSPTDCEGLLCELAEARRRVASGRTLRDAVPDTARAKAEASVATEAGGASAGSTSDAL